MRRPAALAGRFRAAAIGLAAAACLLPGASAQAQLLTDDELRTALIVTVVFHDLGIPIGLLPFPITQLAGETIQYTGNIALKGFRPYLTRPASNFDQAFLPSDDGDADACSYSFYLPNNSATFENMFGVVSIRSPYYDSDTDTHFSWAERWGVLSPPDIWHANTAARLDVRSISPVRRWNEQTGTLSDPYYPILDPWSPVPGTPRVFNVPQPARQDQDGEPAATEPQKVYLPIGTHTMEWTAATQLNVLADIAVPGILLAFAVHSEIKTAKAGVKMGKKAKEAADKGEDLARFTAGPADSINTQLAKRKFDDIWEGLLTRKKPGPIGAQLRSAVCKRTVDVLGSFMDKIIGYGVGVLAAETGEELEQQGLITHLERQTLEQIFAVAVEKGISLATGKIKDAIVSGGCDSETQELPFVLRWIVKALQLKFLQPFATFDTGISRLGQSVIVWDDAPPVWTGTPATLPLEATDFGGTRRYRVIDQARESAMAVLSENCGRVPELIDDIDEALPIGTHTVNWIARDKGPNPNDGQDYAPKMSQMLIVQDTQPPILLVPPSRVIQADRDLPLKQEGVDDEMAVEIGDAVAVDLADVQPEVTNDAPSSFPLDRRTNIAWTATDDSGNATVAPPEDPDRYTQVITVKTTGTNTQPMANDTTAATITAKEVDIRLTAADADVLDGRADPLWFKIESYPQEGDFVAPLYPFFIEDYRTKPGDGLGDAYDPLNDTLNEYIKENFCRQGEDAPLNFVDQARFVAVTDDGFRFVLDQFYTCALSDELDVKSRISKWTAKGEFLGQLAFTSGDDEPFDDSFVIDRDGFLYYNTKLGTGSSDVLGLHKCATNFEDTNDPSNGCSQQHFGSSANPNYELDSASLAYARVDSGNDVTYVADGDDILAFEILDDNSSRYVGEIGPRDENDMVLGDWFGHVAAIEVGKDGSVYVADEQHHRIHKIAPIVAKEDGTLVPGEYVGWSGRCTGSGNKACDDALGRSRGYSCTFEPNSCTPTLDDLRQSTVDSRGAEQGQFDTPKYIAIDPNDILYIADYINERIQRLSPDGSFAGEAVSEGSGINKGERPSFVLGNMGMPASVSVNSSQFYVVDKVEQFVHVFGTLPFKDVTDNEATVTYVSDQDFPDALDCCVDTFTFSVDDGLAVSDPAAVSVTVNRAYRPPVAFDAEYMTVEDTGLVDFELPADDPDGVVNRGDFLGLDTLTWTVTSLPQNGTLSGDGEKRTYQPDPDFYGTDTLTFKVNDGRDDSNEAAVVIDVTPVNDPPKLTVDVPDRVAAGFPTLITSTFTDDPSDGYEAGVSWGDGTVSITGDFVEDENGDPRIEGVVVSEPPMPDVEGRTFAEHNWQTPGPRAVQVCVTDSGQLPGCDTIFINVESLVSLGIGGSTYSGPLPEGEVTQQQVADNESFTYELKIVNEKPDIVTIQSVNGGGTPAAAVTIEAALPNLTYGAINIDRGSCTRDGLALTCVLGDLNPGVEAKLTIEATGPGNLIYDEDFDIEAKLTTLTPALKNEMEFLLSVELLADVTDTDSDGMSDVYEQTYGLDPLRNDSEEDSDGDGLSNQREYELGTSPLDTDSDDDGLSDYDEDMELGTDPANADTDGDGMPDGYELDLGFDPTNASDGDDDADGDGRSNSDEYAEGGNPFRDDVPPEITPPADILVNSTGLLTAVDIGTATATDGADGDLIPSPDTTGPFPPGPNIVTWRAVDANGNRSAAEQRVDVVPIVNFAVDRTVPEKFPVQAIVELNGSAVEYPVVVPYTVGGTATNPDDHDAADGVMTIESGIRGALDIDIVRDRDFEPDETLTLTMGEPVNAVPGVKTSQTITISEPNVGPIVTITMWQDGQPVTTAATGAGPVFVTADLVDYVEDSHSFDWSHGDAGVTDPADLVDDSYEFDPSDLGEGIYKVRVIVTDDGTPIGVSDVETLLKVVTGDSAPGDADGDRIPDDVDDILNTNQLRVSDAGGLIETETGLTLRLGEAAFRDGSTQAGNSEAAIAEDPNFGFPSGTVDFEITGLVPASSAQVVVPLTRAIPANAAYRKYVDGRWQDFVVDQDNGVASAPGANAACPPPGSADYVPGLQVGFGCVQLTIEDGGPNDADQAPNGVVRDPGGLAVPVSVSLEAIPVADRTVTRTEDPVIMRLKLTSDSGDVELTGLTLDASGLGNDTLINAVRVLVDADGNGLAGANDPEIATGQYDRDDGTLELTMATPYEVMAGATNLLIVYDF